MASPWRAVWARSIAPQDVLEARERASRMTAAGVLGPVNPPVVFYPGHRTSADLRAEGECVVQARARAACTAARRPQLWGRAATYGAIMRGRRGGRAWTWRLVPDCFGASVEGALMLLDHDFGRVVGREGQELRVFRGADALTFELEARSALADPYDLVGLGASRGLAASRSGSSQGPCGPAGTGSTTCCGRIWSNSPSCDGRAAPRTG
jgi:hypothetical protein